ncbi:hypothetical protein EXIGLDRAFT_718075 [Exidia glandulosa HHB12029]|uniref:Uncharacterized protein n=1 Tax=Exidia glandulosa HHB12029 TaxID=1314781 RepID=A0A165I0D8_EXIGL|nr:hypothetical protein EXIGLDRAFT_718075 [Exidia glandulosa HHB12029]
MYRIIITLVLTHLRLCRRVGYNILIRSSLSPCRGRLSLGYRATTLRRHAIELGYNFVSRAAAHRACGHLYVYGWEWRQGKTCFHPIWDFIPTCTQ